METYESELMEVIHSTAADLHEIGAFDQKTMCEFDNLCRDKAEYPPSEEIRTTREKEMDHLENSIERFVQAQSKGVYERALAEIKAGRKRSHWMRFVFPQVAGLGFSAACQYYGIKSLEEAKEYLAHPVLGPRLREITQALLELPDPDPENIFGYPDDLKLCSSLTFILMI